ncbi:uncharacterized protein LOC112184749 [Rosa chinensis]|uniref:uncharacterized protein LOC112184749 n=1 Tax=Rosa chinensis TaxID=74649 RepID=UPI000D0875E3|nr:uncharacterized protein LOC112184749 [Rosa chinensis]
MRRTWEKHDDEGDRRHAAEVGIPDAVELRPLRDGEMAANPAPGWVALHENQLHQGLSLPLPRCLQYLLRMLNLSPGQLTPNAVRQIYSMMAMWDLCQQGWPSINEFRAVHRVLYSRKQSCAGTVTFAARDYEPLVTDMPTLMSKRWRNKVFLAGGRWQIKNKKWQLTGTFQAIGDQSYTLSEVEKKRIARVYAVWSEKERSSRFIRHSILFRLGLGWLPVAVKAPKRKPRKGKEEDRMDDAQLIDMLMSQGEDALHINVDLGSKGTSRSIEETLLEITDEGYGEPDPDAPVTHAVQPSMADVITIDDTGVGKVPASVPISSRSTGSDEALLPGEKKRSQKHKHRTDKEVTYTGRDVQGTGAKRQKKGHPGSGLSPSLGLLSPAVPVIPKKPIKQLLNEYGVADEKFVRSMLGDLKDIDLDRVRAKDNTPQENRRLARESMMQALFNVYAIDASEEDTHLKEEVSNLSGQVKYLHGEKAKLEKEWDSLRAEMAASKQRIAELEGEVTEAREEVKNARDSEKKAAESAVSWKEKADSLEDRLPPERHEAVEEYKSSDELISMLAAAQDKAVIMKLKEWVAAGYLDEAKFRRGLLEKRKKEREEAAKSGAGGSQSTDGDQL